MGTNSKYRSCARWFLIFDNIKRPLKGDKEHLKLHHLARARTMNDFSRSRVKPTTTTKQEESKSSATDNHKPQGTSTETLDKAMIMKEPPSAAAPNNAAGEPSHSDHNQFLSDLLTPSPFQSSIQAERQWWSAKQQQQQPQQSNPNVLQQIISDHDMLQSAATFLLSDQPSKSLQNLKVLSLLNNTNTNTNNHPESSWLKLQIVGTIRLATLLIHATYTDPQNSILYSQLAGEILQQLAQRLTSIFQSLSMSTSMSTSMNGNFPMESDSLQNPQSENVRTLGCIRMYLFLLLQVIEPIAGLNMVCATVWRVIGDLASLLGPRLEGSGHDNDNDNNDNDDNNDIRNKKDERRFLLQAMDRIFILIRQGFQVALAQNGTSNYGGHAGRMGKLMKFFLLRMLQLIPLINCKKHDGGGDDHDHDRALKGYINTMLGFRGMIVIVENPGTDADGSVQQLGKKVDLCVERMLQRFSNSGYDGVGRGKDQVLCSSSSKEILLLLDVRHSLQEGGGGCRRERDFSRIGKWYLLLNSLEQTILTIIEYKLREMSSQDWDACISICDNLVWQIIPMCHEHIICSAESNFATANKFLSRSIKLIGDTMFVLERVRVHDTATSREGTRRSQNVNQIHGIMIRWLGCQSGNKVHIHPMTKEALLAIVQMHIIRSFHQDHAASVPVVAVGHNDALLRTMAKLLLDGRTGNVHRENMGIIFHRLMTISSPSLMPLRQRVESILMTAVVEFIQRLKEPQSCGKRKRSGCTQWMSPTWFSKLGPLMKLLLSAETLWSKMGSTKRDTILTDFSSLLLLDMGNEDKKAKRMCLMITKAPDLLHCVFTLLVGCSYFPKAKKDQMREVFFLALSQTAPDHTGSLALFHFTRHILTSSMTLSQTEQQHFLKAIIMLSSQSSMRNKFGGAILSSFFHLLASKDSAPVSSWRAEACTILVH